MLTLRWDATTLFLDQPGLKFQHPPGLWRLSLTRRCSPATCPSVIIDREGFQKTLRFVGLKKDDYNKNVRLFFEFPNLKILFQHPDEA